MADVLVRGECPHCGQAVEFPTEGTGTRVPCPTCETPFVLAPSEVPPPAVQPPTPPAAKTGTPAPASAAQSSPGEACLSKSTRLGPPPSVPRVAQPALFLPADRAQVKPRPNSGPARQPVAPSPTPVELPPLDRAIAEFGNDPAFAARIPSREQVARAWAWASFQRSDRSSAPSHGDLVAALKKLFPEFRTPKPAPGGARPNKPS